MCGTPIAVLGLLVELLLMRVSLPLALGLATIVLSITIGTLCPILRQQKMHSDHTVFWQQLHGDVLLEKCTHSRQPL